MHIVDKSKREARLEKKRAAERKNQMRWIMFAVIAALGAVALLIFAGQVRTPDVEHTYSQKIGTQLGDPNAPVTIIEYGDFQCGHCNNFYQITESLLISNYVESGQVLLEYRPLGFLGVDSVRAAEASFCAAEQNMFWEYHDVIFENYSSQGGYSEERLLDFAETLVLDQQAFASCLTNGEMAGMVEASSQLAAADGVTGTPSFIVNGRKIEGNIPYSDFQTAIAAAMNGN
jgi:protein-disulfide isomerase